jgi:Protein of unknown function (DUF2934)
MRPTLEETRRAAYDRWERRGWNHGGDRDDWLAAETDLTFHANYRTIVDYPLEGSGRLVLGDGPVRRCRFCERRADSGAPRPVVADRTFLLTGEVCDDCHSDWRGRQSDDLRDFWTRLQCEAPHGPGGRPRFSVAAFKALGAAALLIMPGPELRYFVDTLEWVSNPDHDSDDQVLEGVGCRVYRAPFLGEPPRAVLTRRVDDEAPVPYMLCFLECGGIMMQVPLPMCLRDEDLDGRAIEQPERIPTAGSGDEFREARGVLLPLSVSRRRAGRAYRYPAITS